MKKAIVVISITLLLFSCDLVNYVNKVNFKIINSYYRRSNYKSVLISKDTEINNGDVVNFDVITKYDAIDITKIDFYWTYGIDDPDLWNYAPSQSPEYQKVGTDIELTGEFIFNTSFTGVNWITLKGIAFKKDGSEVVDKIWFNIDNLGPDIDIEPRDLSVIKNLNEIKVRIADGGSEVGVDYNRTSIVLKNSSNELLSLKQPTNSNGTFITEPIRSCSDGEYQVTVIAYDNIGNPNSKSTTFTKITSQKNPANIFLKIPIWNGEEVKGKIFLEYESDKPLSKVILDCSCYGGEYYPNVFGSFPSIDVNNPSQTGIIDIDTSFTGKNYAYFRLFSLDIDGLSSISNIVWCNINNIY